VEKRKQVDAALFLIRHLLILKETMSSVEMVRKEMGGELLGVTGACQIYYPLSSAAAQARKQERRAADKSGYAFRASGCHVQMPSLRCSRRHCRSCRAR
jgi:hypothetical protein